MTRTLPRSTRPDGRIPKTPWLVLLAALATPAALAQEPGAPAMSPEQQAMMAAWQKASTPGPQHARLAEHFAGTWDTTISFWMDPAGEPMVETGTTTSTGVLGGRQIRMDYSGRFMGQPFEGIGYTGYDNVRGKYTGTWADNMSTSTMLSEGEYDDATRTYTFRGLATDPMRPDAQVPVRETIRIVDPDHHVMEMFESHEGKEALTMRIEYRRAD